MSLSGRFVMGVTMSAILFVIAGYIASGFFDATRQTALVFMLQYGVSEKERLCRKRTSGALARSNIPEASMHTNRIIRI